MRKYLSIDDVRPIILISSILFSFVGLVIGYLLEIGEAFELHSILSKYYELKVLHSDLMIFVFLIPLASVIFLFILPRIEKIAFYERKRLYFFYFSTLAGFAIESLTLLLELPYCSLAFPYLIYSLSSYYIFSSFLLLASKERKLKVAYGLCLIVPLIPILRFLCLTKPKFALFYLFTIVISLVPLFLYIDGNTALFFRGKDTIENFSAMFMFGAYLIGAHSILDILPFFTLGMAIIIYSYYYLLKNLNIIELLFSKRIYRRMISISYLALGASIAFMFLYSVYPDVFILRLAHFTIFSFFFIPHIFGYILDTFPTISLEYKEYKLKGMIYKILVISFVLLLFSLPLKIIGLHSIMLSLSGVLIIISSTLFSIEMVFNIR